VKRFSIFQIQHLDYGLAEIDLFETMGENNKCKERITMKEY
jgi:hypothetical protein